MWAYVSLVAITLVYVVYWYITRTFDYWKKRNVAGPEPVPLFGNMKDSALRRTFIGSVFEEAYHRFPKDKIVGMYRMTTPCVLLRDLDIIKQVMIKDFDLFTDRGIEFSKEGLGANLFHADGDTWRLLRTRFTPIFTSGKLKNMFSLISERADKFMDHFEDIWNTKLEHDMHSVARMYTMSSIAACAFGLDIDFNNNRMTVLERLDKLILNVSHVFEIDMMYPGILKTLNLSLFPAEVSTFFLDLVKTVISQRNGIPSNRNDFMDVILELKQQKVIHSSKNIEQSELSLDLTDDVIAAQAGAFYFAGFETSSTTLAFLLFELAKNPEIQDKAIAEVDKVLKKNGGNVTYDDLLEMTYLGKLFDETLRKYPIIDPLQRKAHVNYNIPGTDVTIEKGQLVYVSTLGIHHDPELYPNPYVFDPERFTVENCKNRHPCAYLPFGIGPRNCIGMRFAKIQSRMFLVKLLSMFRVEVSSSTPEKLKYDPARIILGPHNGVLLKVVPRSECTSRNSR